MTTVLVSDLTIPSPEVAQLITLFQISLWGPRLDVAIVRSDCYIQNRAGKTILNRPLDEYLEGGGWRLPDPLRRGRDDTA